MKAFLGTVFATMLLALAPACAEDHHDHPVPEKLGQVSFRTSCNPAVEADFDRAVALLHSFAYGAARQAFGAIVDRDPRCAMASWGRAMSHYHQLWEPQVDSQTELDEGAADIARAAAVPGVSAREAQFIEALGKYYADRDREPPALRAQRYASAMQGVAHRNPDDDEAQIFYALALVATASPQDKTHGNQKRAAAILEPIWHRQPDHPGLAHYLIHAYDSTELAPQGLAAARAYSKIAPSVPHALHMPSHIFTRLGLWEDSVASNLAARDAAHKAGDIGEELHAMDYLTYAYLQLGKTAEAANVVADLRAMKDVPAAQFKAGYAATAMPVRLAVETKNWSDAIRLQPLSGSPAKVMALVYWARALGSVRGGARSADADIASLQSCLEEQRKSGDAYWATQTDVMLKEVQAWRSAAAGEEDAAIAGMRAAADTEDTIEKLPVTPGPIVPAREQLGEMLLELHHPAEALGAFQAALRLSPGRRGARLGTISAGQQLPRQTRP